MKFRVWVEVELSVEDVADQAEAESRALEALKAADGEQEVSLRNLEVISSQHREDP